jgi:DNA-binding NarL/FixJ family response regulator
MNTTLHPTHILLVHEQQLVRAGLRLLLESEPDFSVVAEAGTCAEALTAARANPDIILLDLKLGRESGLDVLLQLPEVSDHARVIVLTDSPEAEPQQRAVRHGAMGVVIKTEAPMVLHEAIRKVRAGEAWLNRAIVASVLRDLVYPKDPEPHSKEIPKHQRITEREREVIALVGEGLRNKQIAERLYISEATVRHYLTSIFEKVGVLDRLGLIIYAYQHGLAKLPSHTEVIKREPYLNGNGKMIHHFAERA